MGYEICVQTLRATPVHAFEFATEVDACVVDALSVARGNGKRTFGRLLSEFLWTLRAANFGVT